MIAYIKRALKRCATNDASIVGSTIGGSCIEISNATTNSSVDNASTNIDSSNSRRKTLILNISSDSSENYDVIYIIDSDDGSMPPLYSNRSLT